MSDEQSKLRRTIIAEEDAVIDFRFALIDLLNHVGMTKDQLAKKLGVTKSRVSQLFASESNPTLKQIARVLDALDYKLSIKFDPSEFSIGQFPFEFEKIEPISADSVREAFAAWARITETESYVGGFSEVTNDNYGPHDYEEMKPAA